jgi:hypothetical protein
MVRLYLDESGGGGESPVAVVGGMLINYSHYLHFEEAWDQMLDSHGIGAPLHMKEFGKHKRLGSISRCCRREIFIEVAELINSHKIGSLSATLTNSEYEEIVPAEIRKVYSPYVMCFILAVAENHKLAEGRYEKKIPFILDVGNPFAEHVRQGHAGAVQLQRNEGFLHVGGLYFDNDAEFGTLQAADVIAWTIRRLASGKTLPPGMEPLAEVVAFEKDHRDERFKKEWMIQMRRWGSGKDGTSETRSRAARKRRKR